MIKIGVYDSHPILREALTQYVGGVYEDFESEEINIDVAIAAGTIKTDGVNVVLVCVHPGEVEPLEFVKQLTQRFERLRCIVILMEPAAAAVTLAIKNGAKGILAPGATKQDLVQAILTVRNGFEYFSKQVTDVLVNKYVDGVVAGDKRKDGKAEPDIDMLSSRQIEILKLWGSNMSNKDIADKLFLSVRTVESHKNHIMQKLNLKTTVDIIRFGIRNNIIDL